MQHSRHIKKNTTITGLVIFMLYILLSFSCGDDGYLSSYGNYLKPEDIYKRPLAKFIQDIAEQLTNLDKGELR